MDESYTVSIERKLEAVLRFIDNREAEFNRFSERESLGVFLRRGQLYPQKIGQTHTGRILRGLL